MEACHRHHFIHGFKSPQEPCGVLQDVGGLDEVHLLHVQVTDNLIVAVIALDGALQ